MPQFTTRVRGLDLHFVRVPCTQPRQPGAAPAPALLLTHGWPGSVFEFHKVLEPLARDFDVIAPSMPGYGFSEAPAAPGFSVVEVARTNHALMQQLGYARYYAQGGDWGSVVTRCLGVLYPDHCQAIHLNMPVAGPPDAADPMRGLSEQEAKDVMGMAAFRKTGVGYQAIQGTRPQTLAYGLTDSPAGLLGWIVEKFRAWADCRPDGRIESSGITRDELLTNVMLYWVSRSIGPSMRLYYESMNMVPGTSREMLDLGGRYVQVPTGIASFRDIFRPPKAWIERTHNVCQFTRFERGGHFAALERPEDLAADVAEFFLRVVPRSARRDKPAEHAGH